MHSHAIYSTFSSHYRSIFLFLLIFISNFCMFGASLRIFLAISVFLVSLVWSIYNYICKIKGDLILLSVIAGVSWFQLGAKSIELTKNVNQLSKNHKFICYWVFSMIEDPKKIMVIEEEEIAKATVPKFVNCSASATGASMDDHHHYQQQQQKLSSAITFNGVIIPVDLPLKGMPFLLKCRLAGYVLNNYFLFNFLVVKFFSFFYYF